MGDTNSATTLKGMHIRFDSQAMAAEGHTTLVELRPGRTWLKFVIGYEVEAFFYSPAARLQLECS